jgi:tRNA threonylcarbamoyladenosine biosynthesis protein TsaB
MYLAFDTSGAVGSVAVARGGSTLARVRLERALEHAAGLLPAIGDALAGAGVDRSELRGVVVGEGPGSFTGVRVAAATAKGLARALDVPLWAVSSLAGTALAADVGPIRYVLFDARADRVYGACYGVGAAGVQTLVTPHAGRLRDVLDADVPGGAVFLGDGADRHRAAIEGAGFAVAEPGRGSLADGLFAYMAFHPDTAPVARVDEWEPRYIREWSGGRS